MENNLPDTWELVKLVEQLNFMPTGVKEFEGTKKYFSTGSIQENEYTAEGEFTFSNRPSRANRIGEIGDVLQARMKATDKGILIDEKLDGQLFSTGFLQVRPFGDTYNKRLLYYLIKSEFFLSQKNELATGSTQEALTDNGASEIEIPLPPIAEQNRIVEKLETVMQKVERNKHRLERIPIIVKQFRQSVLNAAVNGKLSEVWREQNKDVQNIFDVIGSITEQRKLDYENLINEMSLLGKSKPRKPENLIPTVTSIDDFPETWGTMTFSDISSTKQYSMSSGPFGSSLGTKDYKVNGVPVVRGQNIQGGLFIAKNFVFISNEKAIELTRSSAVPNDIVIVAVGVGVGNAAIIPNEIDRIILSQNCNKFTLDSKVVVPKFILFNLQVSNIKEQMDEVTTDTAREFLSLTNLKKLLFPIPPLEEQKEIVKQVEKLFAFADKLEARYTKAKTMIDKLPQSILAKAFRGELVAQDPNDEPASVLLERIKKEKEKLTAEKKGKKVNGFSKKEKPIKVAAEKKVKYKKAKV